jgi:hypothetical protein
VNEEDGVTLGIAEGAIEELFSVGEGGEGGCVEGTAEVGNGDVVVDFFDLGRCCV